MLKRLLTTLLFVGAVTPLARRTGQIFGGLSLAASGVLFVLAVRYGYDLGYDEIGAALGSTEAAARQAASAGVRRLRKEHQ